METGGRRRDEKRDAVLFFFLFSQFLTPLFIRALTQMNPVMVWREPGAAQKRRQMEADTT